MKEDKFISNNINIWQNLEKSLKRIKTKGFKGFNNDELNDLLNLYNLTSGHLSYCRTNFGNTGTTNYLNRLVASAHSYIYTSKTSNIKNIFRFLFVEFPILVKQNLNYLIVSTSIFVLGIVLSYVFTMINPENAAAFLPANMLKGIDFSGNAHKLLDSSSLTSSFILTNNINVGFQSFAFGITLGLGTAYVLINNGFIIGCLSALMGSRGMNLKFFSLVLPHGILELFAIFICGAAGLLIGYSIISPGKYSRKDSFILRGKTAIKLVCGSVPIFVIAGIIEGFFTPSGVNDYLKLLFALFTLLVLLFYIIYPNYQKHRKLNL